MARVLRPALADSMPDRDDDVVMAGPEPRTIRLAIVTAPPTPVDALVSHMPHRGGYFTSIARVFGDDAKRDCGRCDGHHCTLTESGMCMVSVDQYVPVELAAEFVRPSPLPG